MRYVIAGASGFLGRALRAELAQAGHVVTRLVRTPPYSPDESAWDPYRRQLDLDVLRAADVVVNLAGASIGRPWTRAHRARLRTSRVETTRTIATAVATLAAEGTAPAFVAQSGSGYYPGRPTPTGPAAESERAEPALGEDAAPGSDFLSGVAQAWEAAADIAREADARVITLRTGLVLDRSGGVFVIMSMPFQLGLGARFGAGHQYMPVVSVRDWVRAVRFTAENPGCAGPYNVTVPHPPTNAEFTRALADALRRPSALRVPARVLRSLLGELSTELLHSRRLVPRRLLDAGFEFEAPDIDAVIHAALHRL